MMFNFWSDLKTVVPTNLSTSFWKFVIISHLSNTISFSKLTPRYLIFSPTLSALKVISFGWTPIHRSSSTSSPFFMLIIFDLFMLILRPIWESSPLVVLINSVIDLWELENKTISSANAAMLKFSNLLLML